MVTFDISLACAGEARVNDISKGNKLEFGNGEVSRAGYVSIGVDYPAAIGAIINFYQLQQVQANEKTPSDTHITINLGKDEFLDVRLFPHITQLVHGMPYVPDMYGFSLKKGGQTYSTTHFLSPELVALLQKDLRESTVRISKVKSYATMVNNNRFSANTSCQTSKKDGPIKRLTLDYIVDINDETSSIRLFDLDFKQPTHGFDLIVKASSIINGLVLGGKNTHTIKLVCEAESGNLISEIGDVRFFSN